jgi:hypothetical protein
MKGFRFLTSAAATIALAVIGTTLGCSRSQPSAPSPLTTQLTTQSGSVPASAASHDTLSAATLQELAEARNATAKYHDVEQALADGYVRKGYGPGEGFHYVNSSLMDCTFDLEHPETLLYVPSGEGLRLVGVEYSLPSSCSATAPEGFTGDADEWEANAEGRPVWALVAWLWLGNPNGVFAEPPHPQIPLAP